MTTTQVRERGIIFGAESVRAILAGAKTMTRRVMVPQPREDIDHGPRGLTRRAVVGFRHVSTHARTGCTEWQADGANGQPVYAFRHGKDSIKAEIACPYGAVGDRLWVREAFFDHGNYALDTLDSIETPRDERIEYRAEPWDRKGDPVDAGGWSPSIHMPRWASRLTLEITDVRVERVQAITEADARAEGVDRASWPEDATGDDAALNAEFGYFPPRQYTAGFARLWDRINAKRQGGAYSWDQDPFVWVLTFRRHLGEADAG